MYIYLTFACTWALSCAIQQRLHMTKNSLGWCLLNLSVNFFIAPASVAAAIWLAVTGSPIIHIPPAPTRTDHAKR